MAINPISVPRVSHNLRSLTLLDQLRANALNIFREQQRIATGRSLLAPSDDPVRAGKVLQLNELLQRQNQIVVNLRHAERLLSASEAGVAEVSDLLLEAKTIALDQVNSFHEAEQRAAAAQIIDGIIDRVIAIGNQRFGGKYLYAGHRIDAAPLDTTAGRARFAGDTSDQTTLVDFGQQRAFNVTVDRLLGLSDRQFDGFVDLNPALTTDTRLSDLGGASAAGIRTGVFRVTQIGGSGGVFEVDLDGVDTAGSLLDRFNAAAAAAGSTLTLSLTASGFQVNGGAGIQIVVEEVGEGHAAGDLGILGASAVGAPLVGADVNPLLAATTPLSALNGGAGLNLAGGLLITIAGQTVTVDFSGAATLQDVLNRINGAGAGVRVAVNAARTGLTVLNEISGERLGIGENGGSAATALGIRTFHAATPLADLNGGRGVTDLPGADFRVTDSNGLAFDVDIAGAVTVQNVIDRINAAATAAGSTLTAGLRATGNGLQLAQSPAGPQSIAVTSQNLSAAAADLGILKTGAPAALDGDDVNPQEASGALTALYRLADALRANDEQAITAASERIEEAVRGVAAQRGLLGARSRSIAERNDRIEDAVLATRRFLSELQDTDLTEAVTRFQQAQLALQANLQTGAALANLSLLDFLR